MFILSMYYISHLLVVYAVTSTLAVRHLSCLARNKLYMYIHRMYRYTYYIHIMVIEHCILTVNNAHISCFLAVGFSRLWMFIDFPAQLTCFVFRTEAFFWRQFQRCSNLAVSSYIASPMFMNCGWYILYALNVYDVYNIVYIYNKYVWYVHQNCICRHMFRLVCMCTYAHAIMYLHMYT
jgi:hypothetical protein